MLVAATCCIAMIIVALSTRAWGTSDTYVARAVATPLGRADVNTRLVAGLFKADKRVTVVLGTRVLSNTEEVEDCEL